jgi:hypothetical protein
MSGELPCPDYGMDANTYLPSVLATYTFFTIHISYLLISALGSFTLLSLPLTTCPTMQPYIRCKSPFTSLIIASDKAHKQTALHHPTMPLCQIIYRR